MALADAFLPLSFAGLQLSSSQPSVYAKRRLRCALDQVRASMVLAPKTIELRLLSSVGASSQPSEHMRTATRLLSAPPIAPVPTDLASDLPVGVPPLHSIDPRTDRTDCAIDLSMPRSDTDVTSKPSFPKLSAVLPPPPTRIKDYIRFLNCISTMIPDTSEGKIRLVRLWRQAFASADMSLVCTFVFPVKHLQKLANKEFCRQHGERKRIAQMVPFTQALAAETHRARMHFEHRCVVYRYCRMPPFLVVNPNTYLQLRFSALRECIGENSHEVQENERVEVDICHSSRRIGSFKKENSQKRLGTTGAIVEQARLEDTTFTSCQPLCRIPTDATLHVCVQRRIQPQSPHYYYTVRTFVVPLARLVTRQREQGTKCEWALRHGKISLCSTLSESSRRTDSSTYPSVVLSSPGSRFASAQALFHTRSDTAPAWRVPIIGGTADDGAELLDPSCSLLPQIVTLCSSSPDAVDVAPGTPDTAVAADEASASVSSVGISESRPNPTDQSEGCHYLIMDLGAVCEVSKFTLEVPGGPCNPRQFQWQSAKSLTTETQWLPGPLETLTQGSTACSSELWRSARFWRLVLRGNFGGAELQLCRVWIHHPSEEVAAWRGNPSLESISVRNTVDAIEHGDRHSERSGRGVKEYSLELDMVRGERER